MQLTQWRGSNRHEGHVPEERREGSDRLTQASRKGKKVEADHTDKELRQEEEMIR